MDEHPNNNPEKDPTPDLKGAQNLEEFNRMVAMMEGTNEQVKGVLSPPEEETPPAMPS